jgi:hypothetical protein
MAKKSFAMTINVKLVALMRNTIIAFAYIAVKIALMI